MFNIFTTRFIRIMSSMNLEFDFKFKENRKVYKSFITYINKICIKIKKNDKRRNY